MHQYYKITSVMILTVMSSLMTSCTIVKLVYNQFSDEDEFILFNKKNITDSTSLSKSCGLSAESATNNIDTAYQYCIIDSLYNQILK